jgi:hypothetical protein
MKNYEQYQAEDSSAKCNFEQLMLGWPGMFSIQGFLTWQSKSPMTYKHLSQAERYQIHALLKVLNVSESWLDSKSASSVNVTKIFANS